MLFLFGSRGVGRFVLVALTLYLASSCSSSVDSVDPPVDESTLLPEQLVFRYIIQGEDSKLDSLLKSSPELVSIREDNTNYNTPLHVAAIIGDWSVVKVLIENGADPYLENINGEIPAESALQSSGDLELSRYLRALPSPSQ
ncbi:MAG: hypothetical protein JNK74_22035 [Candidatus Hydrogenedentes bacterium]|nr:hypothetical protein [Candidatus Hydrogenedentota bacterium]